MKQFYSFTKITSCLLFLFSLSFLHAQITSEFDNGLGTDPNNDSPDLTIPNQEVVEFSPPGGVTGDFQKALDIDVFPIDINVNADFEVVVLGTESGFSQSNPGYTIRILGYSNADRVGNPAEDFLLEHGDDQRLNGFSLYYSLKITQNTNGASTYTVILAEGDGSDGNAVLPVEWLSFQAKKNPEGVKLLWLTASEENNRGFFIERSNDAFSWENLGFVEGAGNTPDIQIYTFLDPSPQVGFNYYRVKQTDFNGEIDYSSIREVHIGQESFSQTFLVYPNPFRKVLYTGPLNGQISLISSSGKQILQKEVNGTWSEENLEHLPPGPYFLLIRPDKGLQKEIPLFKY